MGLSLEVMRKKVRKPLGVDADDLPDEDTDLLLNTSYWELLDKFPFREKEVAIAFDTIAGERTYELPCSFEALRSVSIVIDGQHSSIEPATLRTQESELNEKELDVPTHYVREARYIRLLPTPKDAYKIYLRYLTELADIVAGTAPIIPQAWHEVIVYGAVWRGFGEFGDVNRMTVFKNMQIALIDSMVPAESKEEGDRHMAGLEVPIRRDY